VPAVFGSGLSSLWPFEQEEYEADLAAHRAVPSPLRMSVRENAPGDFSARVYAETDVSDAFFVMVAVLAEDVSASEGTWLHLPYHAKLFLTGYLGEAFSIAAGESAVIRRTFDPDPAWTYADMGVVCWVQRDGGVNPSPSPDVPIKHEVLQAAYAPAAVAGVPGHPAGARIALRAPAPNPSAGPIRVAFSTDARGAFTLAVYDVAGRRVAVLFDGVKEPGDHDAVWDGRDARGRRLPSGIYFVRLSSGESRAATRRTVLIR
jgi:hypothetical protein